jgi:hypothetical protein
MAAPMNRLEEQELSVHENHSLTASAQATTVLRNEVNVLPFGNMRLELD